MATNLVRRQTSSCSVSLVLTAEPVEENAKGGHAGGGLAKIIRTAPATAWSTTGVSDATNRSVDVALVGRNDRQ
ncbi:MAG TPA: hypothetical protein VND96_15520 [Candidatus Micrarchaeaceae archaeon]|nr:hypothetical protein [Candidatus Micrarchaeaceae archaeon]